MIYGRVVYMTVLSKWENGVTDASAGFLGLIRERSRFILHTYGARVRLASNVSSNNVSYTQATLQTTRVVAPASTKLFMWMCEYRACFVFEVRYSDKQIQQLEHTKEKRRRAAAAGRIICKRIERDEDRECIRTYFLDSEVSVASIDPADPDWRAWDWGRIALDDDDVDEWGFPLRVSSTRADSATPSQPYLNQYRLCNALQGDESSADSDDNSSIYRDSPDRINSPLVNPQKHNVCFRFFQYLFNSFLWHRKIRFKN